MTLTDNQQRALITSNVSLQFLSHWMQKLESWPQDKQLTGCTETLACQMMSYGLLLCRCEEQAQSKHLMVHFQSFSALVHSSFGSLLIDMGAGELAPLFNPYLSSSYLFVSSTFGHIIGQPHFAYLSQNLSIWNKQNVIGESFFLVNCLDLFISGTTDACCY